MEKLMKGDRPAWLAGAALVLMSGIGLVLSHGHKATWVQTGALVGTAILIIWYAWETRRMAQATTAQLKSQHLSDMQLELEPSVEHPDGRAFKVTVANAGPSAASRVRLCALWDASGGVQHSAYVERMRMLSDMNALSGRDAASIWAAGLLLPTEKRLTVLPLLHKDDASPHMVRLEWENAAFLGLGTPLVRCWVAKVRPDNWYSLSPFCGDNSGAECSECAKLSGFCAAERTTSFIALPETGGPSHV